MTCLSVVVCSLLSPGVSAWAGTIDTEFLERPWPRQWVHEYEVGRDTVQWRQRASRTEGIFAGVRFTAPLDPQRVWSLTSDYADVGRMTPGVTAVRVLEETPTRKVVQVDVKVLWKTLRLNFEVEQEPPRAMRFRLVNEALGEYRGVCVLTPAADGAGQHAPGTVVEMSTWLNPSRPVPAGLLLLVERMTFLRGARSFLESCEGRSR